MNSTHDNAEIVSAAEAEPRPRALFGAMGAPGQVGAQTFLGLSLLPAGWRTDAGCEVMSLPGLLLGHRTHLMCFLFSPIDWLETQLESHNT